MFYLYFLVHFSSFMLFSPSIALFIALLICFELFIAFTCLNNVIYRFIYIYHVLVNMYCVVIIPLPCVLVRQNSSGFGGLCKPSMRP